MDLQYGRTTAAQHPFTLVGYCLNLVGVSPGIFRFYSSAGIIHIFVIFHFFQNFKINSVLPQIFSPFPVNETIKRRPTQNSMPILSISLPVVTKSVQGPNCLKLKTVPWHRFSQYCACFISG